MDKKRVIVSFALDTEELAVLEAWAKLQRRTRSSFIRNAIEDAINDAKKDEDEKKLKEEK